MLCSVWLEMAVGLETLLHYFISLWPSGFRSLCIFSDFWFVLWFLNVLSFSLTSQFFAFTMHMKYGSMIHVLLFLINLFRSILVSGKMQMGFGLAKIIVNLYSLYFTLIWYNLQDKMKPAFVFFCCFIFMIIS